VQVFAIPDLAIDPDLREQGELAGGDSSGWRRGLDQGAVHIGNDLDSEGAALSRPVAGNAPPGF
jgi:hypothetical protein